MLFIELYDRLLKINSYNDRIIYNNLAEIYLRRGDLEKAYYYGSMAIAPYRRNEVPSNPVLYDTMASIMLEKQKPKIAKLYYNRAIAAIDDKLKRITRILDKERENGTLSNKQDFIFNLKIRELNEEKAKFRKKVKKTG